MSFQLDIGFLRKVARQAGAAILDIYGTEFGVEHKADSSPLTEADMRSHRVIVERLSEEYPDVPVLSEENVEEYPYEARKSWTRYFLVDPLDGTKEFIKRNGQFTVNIALIEDSRPVAGVVYAPVLDWLYWGSPEGGAFKQDAGGPPVRLQPQPSEEGRLRIVGSRSHPSPAMQTFLEEQLKSGADVEMIAVGSSLKLCMVAEGSADLYPRLGPTSEWDTAAAHAVVNAAGRRVLSWGSEDELPYNKENILNSWFIVR